MFGSLGYWASSKGMVAVPDLSGLTEAQASTALSNVVLSYSKIANTQTSDSNLVGKVASQSVAAGTLTNYESTINISIYELAPPPTFPPVWTDEAISTSFTFGVSYSDSVSATNSPIYRIVQPLSGVYSPVSGIGINSSTGQLSGTPSSPNQSFRFRIMADNPDGMIFTQDFSGTVDGGCANLPNTVVNEYEYAPYSPGCQWVYTYQATYNGCGSLISRVFVSQAIVCE